MLKATTSLEDLKMTAWLTTKEMGCVLEAESDELVEERDVTEGRRTGCTAD